MAAGGIQLSPKPAVRLSHGPDLISTHHSLFFHHRAFQIVSCEGEPMFKSHKEERHISLSLKPRRPRDNLCLYIYMVFMLYEF